MAFEALEGDAEGADITETDAVALAEVVVHDFLQGAEYGYDVGLGDGAEGCDVGGYVDEVDGLGLGYCGVVLDGFGGGVFAGYGVEFDHSGMGLVCVLGKWMWGVWSERWVGRASHRCLHQMTDAKLVAPLPYGEILGWGGGEMVGFR